MWPDRVNRRWPGAQFIARAGFERGVFTLPDAFVTLDAPILWGTAIELPAGSSGTGALITVTTDRNETFAAWSDATELLAGDPESVVMAARYWELPWRYVAALREAAAAMGIQIIDEEPRDDAVTNASN